MKCYKVEFTSGRDGLGFQVMDDTYTTSKVVDVDGVEVDGIYEYHVIDPDPLDIPVGLNV